MEEKDGAQIIPATVEQSMGWRSPDADSSQKWL